MAEPTTWTCPSCGRRVPNRIAECHCGMARATALAMAAQPELPPRERIIVRTPPIRLRSLPREVRWLLAGALVVTLLGLGWLFVPGKPRKALYLLGSMDRKPPSPPPTPKPAAKPRPKPRPPGATVLGTPLPAPPRR